MPCRMTSPPARHLKPEVDGLAVSATVAIDARSDEHAEEEAVALVTGRSGGVWASEALGISPT